MLINPHPSPVLTEYIFISFPLITKMFHFIRFQNKINFILRLCVSFLYWKLIDHHDVYIHYYISFII